MYDYFCNLAHILRNIEYRQNRPDGFGVPSLRPFEIYIFGVRSEQVQIIQEIVRAPFPDQRSHAVALDSPILWVHEAMRLKLGAHLRSFADSEGILYVKGGHITWFSSSGRAGAGCGRGCGRSRIIRSIAGCLPHTIPCVGLHSEAFLARYGRVFLRR